MKDNFGNSTSSATDNIKVLVRVRPFDGCTQQQQQKKCVFADDDASVIDLKEERNEQRARDVFKFDFVRDEQATQESIFHTIGRIRGGKIFGRIPRMRDRVRPNGRGKDVHHARMRRGRRGGRRRRRREEEEDGRYRWIDQRRSRRILSSNKTTGEEDVTHEVTCAYLEIYNEQLTDLLSDGDGNSDGIGMDGMMVDAREYEAIRARIGEAAESWRYAKIQEGDLRGKFDESEGKFSQGNVRGVFERLDEAKSGRNGNE